VFALIQKHLEGCTIHESLHLRWKDMAVQSWATALCGEGDATKLSTAKVFKD